MTSGAYVLTMEVGDRIAPDGWLSIVDDTVRGGDHVYAISGVLRGPANHRIAEIRVELNTGISGNEYVTGAFTMRMFGTDTEERLDLIGTGPLGIIVTIAANRT